MSGLVAALRGRIESTIREGGLAGVPREDVTNLMTGAVKLYAAFAEELEREVPAIDASVSTTEAMVVACALLRAQHMNPFDLALWFSRTTPTAR
ncbi:MAG TPA: hypothetical protein VJO53_04545 [Candidatus Acidoferrales bacterium]|nr:hypothetical protein [Candidatus Acidoferrales bacterium]